MKKTVVISGKTFEVVKVDRVPFYYGQTKTLEQCYNKPSVYKTAIFKEWRDFASDTAINFGILSHNCNFITIGWNEEINGEEVAFRITPSHNYMIIEA